MKAKHQPTKRVDTEDADVGFRDELEAEDSVFGQEHVFRPDAHAVDTFGTESRGKRVIAMEVLPAL